MLRHSASLCLFFVGSFMVTMQLKDHKTTKQQTEPVTVCVNDKDSSSVKGNKDAFVNQAT